MTATAADRKLMTAAELLALPRGVKRYELIRGALVEYPLNGNLAAAAISQIAFAIGNYARSRDYGRAVIGCGYWLERNPDTVRAAAVTWVAPGRIPKGLPGYPELAPDLAVEVKSCGVSHPEIAAKARMWLCYGSQQVWVADPPTAAIYVYRPNAAPVILGADDLLGGGELLPGFSVAVRDLFLWEA